MNTKLGSNDHDDDEIDQQSDRLVYELYGLTGDEIQLVECEAMKR